MKQCCRRIAAVVWQQRQGIAKALARRSAVSLVLFCYCGVSFVVFLKWKNEGLFVDTTELCAEG